MAEEVKNIKLCGPQCVMASLNSNVSLLLMTINALLNSPVAGGFAFADRTERELEDLREEIESVRGDVCFKLHRLTLKLEGATDEKITEWEPRGKAFHAPKRNLQLDRDGFLNMATEVVAMELSLVDDFIRKWINSDSPDSPAPLSEITMLEDLLAGIRKRIIEGMESLGDRLFEEPEAA